MTVPDSLELEIRSYRGHPQDGPGIVSVWNEAIGPAFPLDERLWRQNVDDEPHHDAGGVFVARAGDAVVGFIVARALRPALAWKGANPCEGWINSFAVASAWQRRGVATALFAKAEAWLASRGVRVVRVGGDPGHLFPGVPSEHAGARAFLGARGYASEGETRFDLIQDLRAFTMPRDVARTMATRVSFRCHECTSRTIPALLEFLESTFPGRWLYETRLRLEHERSPREIRVMTLGNRVVGFAHVYSSASQRLGPSVYWRKAMGARPGGLGPIGLAADVRGQGLGLALLCDCIEHLRKSGVEQMGVDWVTRSALYAHAGFREWREYRPFERAL